MSGFESSDPVEAATQVIRDFCGWHVAPVQTHTVTLDGSGSDVVLLPSRAVVEVERVAVHGELLPAESYEWSAIGALRRLDGVWPDRYRSIEITLQHGLSDMAALADIVEAIAARIRMDRTGALSQQRAGSQYIGFGAGYAGGGLMASEKERLQPYRLNWGP